MTAGKRKRYKSAKIFEAVDDALYFHESPFYRDCAGGAIFVRTPEWDAERKKLTDAWYALCPYKTPKPKPKKSIFHRLANWWKSKP